MHQRLQSTFSGYAQWPGTTTGCCPAIRGSVTTDFLIRIRLPAVPGSFAGSGAQVEKDKGRKRIPAPPHLSHTIVMWSRDGTIEMRASRPTANESHLAGTCAGGDFVAATCG